MSLETVLNRISNTNESVSEIQYQSTYFSFLFEALAKDKFSSRKRKSIPHYYPHLLTTGQLLGNLTILITVIILYLLSKNTLFKQVFYLLNFVKTLTSISL